MNNKNYHAILHNAQRYFGNKESALYWINTPARALQYRKPIDMINSEKDTQKVLNLLGRLSHGVYT